MLAATSDGGEAREGIARLRELGESLRAIRIERGHSLAYVAQATDLSPSFLSLVETGKSDLSIGRLMRLVKFYGVHIGDLLASGDTPDVSVRRSEERREVSSSAEGISMFLLATHMNGDMMAVLVQYAPGGGAADYAQHSGEEFVYVIEGSVELDIEGSEPISLRGGDSACYRSDRRHRFRNTHRQRALMLSVTSPPVL